MTPPRNGHPAGYSDESAHPDPDHEHYVTLTDLDRNAESGVMYISDVRRHNDDNGVFTGEEQFYYKPYAHLQQQVQQERRGKGVGHQTRCLQWCFRNRSKNLVKSVKHGSSFSANGPFSFQHARAGEDVRERPHACGQESDQRFSNAGPDWNKISLRDYWADFLSQTSWHGCRTIVDTSKRMVIR